MDELKYYNFMGEYMYELKCYITVDEFDVLNFVAKQHGNGEDVDYLRKSGYKITKSDIQNTIKAKLEKGVSRSDFDFVSMTDCERLTD